MKVNQLFLATALLLTGVLFSISYWFDLSLSTINWIVSDIIFLGTVLLMAYLAVTAFRLRTPY